jgi:hypothetical protein
VIRPGIRRILRLPLRSRDFAEQELDEEIRFHLEQRIEQLESRGLGPEEARAEALRRFGPPEEARTILRRASQRRERRLHIRDWLFGAWQDVRYAGRSLGRTPGITLVIILTLALGIGLCTSIYSVVRGVILDPAPFPASQQLLSAQIATQSGSEIPLYNDFRVWDPEVGGIVDVAAYAFGPGRIGHEHGTVEAFSVRVSERFFGVLRARPHLGRTLSPADASAPRAPAARGRGPGGGGPRPHCSWPRTWNASTGSAATSRCLRSEASPSPWTGATTWPSSAARGRASRRC